jgi:hypothetical protein
MSRLGCVAARPAEERKNPAGKRIAAAQIPSRANSFEMPFRSAASGVSSSATAVQRAVAAHTRPHGLKEATVIVALDSVEAKLGWAGSAAASAAARPGAAL